MDEYYFVNRVFNVQRKESQMVLIFVISGLILLVGAVEWRSHQKHVDSLPVRVNINGIRGKSTVTRLVTAVLNEAGYKTVGKTTGTSARMMLWNQREEEPVIRRAEGPQFKEQEQDGKQTTKREAE